MSLQIWLPLTGHTRNKGLWKSTTEFSVTNTNFITINDSGKIGKCYNFNSTATNSGIFHSDANYMADYINNHSFSICAWIQTTATDTCVISLSYGVRIFVGDASHTYITLYNSSRTVGCGAGMAVNDGTWHHVCGIYNVDTNKIQFYVDGIKKNEVSYTSGYTYASSWANGLFIGRDPNNSTVNDHYLYKGNMNDVRIYDHAISQAEIKELSKALAVHYKLDDMFSSDNLIVNGFGELGTENWTSSTNISTTEIPSGHSEIKASFYNANMNTNYIPVCATHRYTRSGYIKAMSGKTGNTYPSLYPYDYDKKFIAAHNSKIGFDSATLTTLSQPLNTGDTVIHATDLSKWRDDTTSYYFHVAIFGYKNSIGEVYGDLEYTQDSPKFGSRTDKSNIDKTNNTITLLSAYTGAYRPAGTSICQATKGATYYYPWGGINVANIQDWTYKSATFTPYKDTRLKYAEYFRWSTYGSVYIAGNKLVDNFLTDTTVIDSSGYRNHGTKNGNMSISYNSARYDISTVFDGTSSYIESDPLPAETKTISIWLKTSWVSSSGYRLAVHDKNTGLAIGWSSNQLITYVGTSNGGSGSRIDITTTNYTANQWNHIVVVKTGSNTRNVYVNGVLATPSSVNYWGGDLIKLNIGVRHMNGSYSAYFNGQLSDFRAYATALSAEDVLELYNVGAKVADSGAIMGYQMKEG